MHELDHHPEQESHYDCEHCRDTGKLDGSDCYDCAHCGVAKQRVKLEERMLKMMRSMSIDDMVWSLMQSERHQVASLKAAEMALLKSKLLQAERELAEVRKDAWQPIETAPKDGMEVFLWLPSPYNRIEKARWFDLWENWQLGDFPDDSDEYCGIGSALPTHWMPLPAPPSIAQDGQKSGGCVMAERYEDRPARSVVCAANKYGDLVFVGVRHFCPIMRFNMHGHDIQALRKEHGEVQGFIDQCGVFMDRKEAAIVAKESGQLARYGDNIPKILFSEDLY